MEISVKKNIMVEETIEYVVDIIMERKNRECKLKKYELDFSLESADKRKVGCLNMIHSANCC